MTHEKFFVDQVDLSNLAYDPPLRFNSPNNLNYLAAYSVPVVNHLSEQPPHFAIGCDRGGRLFSRAIYSMWHELMDRPFPTFDSGLHFARISYMHSKDIESKEKMRQRVKEIISIATDRGEKMGRTIHGGEVIRILFIDDIIKKGDTKKLIEDLISDVGAMAELAVMYNSKIKIVDADAYGTEGSLKKMSTLGMDDPYETGIDYIDIDHPIFVPGAGSIDNFKRLNRSVKRVAGIVRTASY